MRIPTLFAALLLLAAPPGVQAADPAPKPAAGKDAGKDAGDTAFAPLPPDRSIRQSIAVGGRTIAYQATVGSLPVRDDKGKTIGEIVYTAYTIPGAAPGSRPVTFAFNGGPGAASVYLNLGAIGPKRVQFGAQGDAPSDSAVLRDNPGTWLGFTDLVFIDPIGTGFSRSLVDEEASKKAFYAAKPDIEYLSRIVYDWLVKSNRLTSPKYLVGESYGGYRVPRLAFYLQTQLGVGLNGIVMVSPYLDPTAQRDEGTALSPLPWMINLPAMAAGKLERDGRLSEAALADVEAYARGDFVLDFLRGRSDPAAIGRMVARVSAYTGLDPALVARLQGRVDVQTYLRETHRAEGKLGSVYDSNVTSYDPFPSSAERKSGDPILDALIAPTTSAMVDFVTRQVGYRVDARFNALNYKVNELWDRDNEDAPVTDLRKAIANDGKMRVLIAHGMDDLSCPYFASRLIIDQMPPFGEAKRVTLALYPGGHMFYSRPAGALAFRDEAMRMYGMR